MKYQCYPFGRVPRGGNLESSPKGLPSSKAIREGLFSSIMAWAESSRQRMDKSLEVRQVAPANDAAKFITFREAGAIRYIPNSSDLGIEGFATRLHGLLNDSCYVLSFQDIHCYDRQFYQTLLDFLDTLYARFSLPVGHLSMRVKIGYGPVAEAMDYEEKESVLSLTFWGSRRLKVGARVLTANAGEWLYAPPGQSSKFTSDSGFATLEFRFDTDLLGEDLKHNTINSVLDEISNFEIPEFYPKGNKVRQPPQVMKKLYSEVRRAKKGLDFERMATRLWLERLTGRGLINFPPLIPETVEPGDIFKTIPNRPILWAPTKNGRELVISISGNSVVMIRDEAVLGVIRELNGGSSVSLSALSKTMKPSSMAKIEALLTALFYMGAFESEERFVLVPGRPIDQTYFQRHTFAARVDS